MKTDDTRPAHEVQQIIEALSYRINKIGETKESINNNIKLFKSLRSLREQLKNSIK